MRFASSSAIAKSDEIDNTEYTWYEFNKIEDAPEKIGNLKKGIKTYMVFDGKIRNDYLNYSELDINVNIKYFYNNEKGDITIALKGMQKIIKGKTNP